MSIRYYKFNKDDIYIQKIKNTLKLLELDLKTSVSLESNLQPTSDLSNFLNDDFLEKYIEEQIELIKNQENFHNKIDSMNIYNNSCIVDNPSQRFLYLVDREEDGVVITELNKLGFNGYYHLNNYDAFINIEISSRKKSDIESITLFKIVNLFSKKSTYFIYIPILFSTSENNTFYYTENKKPILRNKNEYVIEVNYKENTDYKSDLSVTRNIMIQNKYNLY